MRSSKRMQTRFWAVLAALCMMLSMLPLSAMAAAPAGGAGKITVTAPKGLKTPWGLSGDQMQVEAYLVFEQVNPEESDKSYKIYKVNSAFSDFFNVKNVKSVFDGSVGDVYITYNTTNNQLEASASKPNDATPRITISNRAELDATYPEADLASRISDAGELIAMYEWLEQYIKANNLEPQATQGATSSKSELETDVYVNNDIMFTGLQEGGYALIFKDVPDGIAVNQGILVASSSGGGPAVQVAMKAQDMPLTKEVSPQGIDYGSTTSAAMGQVLYYRITTQVPNPTADINYVEFRLTDTMKNQVVDPASFEMSLGGNEVAFSEGVFTIGNAQVAALTVGKYDADTNSQSFTLEFNEAALDKYRNQSLTVTYQASLTADAVSVNDNEVQLHYSNGPYEYAAKADTQVYTYGVVVNKVFSDDLNDFDGVTFQLYTGTDTDSSVQPMSFYTAGEGVYKLADEVNGTAGTSMTLTPNATDGTLTLLGLDDGTYTLVETKSPNGYILSADIEIVLKASADNEAVLDETGTTITIQSSNQTLKSTVSAGDASTVSTVSFEVLNQKGFTLPQTGGEGTWWFTIAGIGLIGAAGGLFLGGKKRKGQ